MKKLYVGPVGFCSGVQNAVDGIQKILKDGKKVYTDGEIVHNERVMKRLIESGLHFGEYPQSKDSIFAIRAHGLRPEKRKSLQELYEVVDYTCPIVESLFKLAHKKSLEGWYIAVFGKPEHPEMVAISGYFVDGKVTQEPEVVEREKILIISQTTSQKDKFYNFVDRMKELNKNKDVKFIDTICRYTVDREDSARELSKMCDLVIVVGGKNSANTKKLYDVAKERTKALHIESLEELKKYDLENFENVGVISGTSTSKEDVEEIILYLNSLGFILSDTPK